MHARCGGRALADGQAVGLRHRVAERVLQKKKGGGRK